MCNVQFNYVLGVFRLGRLIAHVDLEVESNLEDSWSQYLISGMMCRDYACRFRARRKLLD